MSGSDHDGEDLDDTWGADYSAVSTLDRYDSSMIDDVSRNRRLSSSSRRAAEAAMAARDERASYASSTRNGVIRAPRAMGQVHANQEGMLEISRLSKCLKLAEEIVNKASEFLRKAYTGIRCFDQSAKECLPAACVEMASQACKRPLRRERMMQHCAVKQKEYGRTLSILHAQLGIQREISIGEICSDFRCQAIKASSRHMLEVFKQQFWASLIEARREHADFSRPVFAIIAVLLTAERNKAVVKVPDRKELMQYAGVSDDDFKYVHEQMTKLCTISALHAGAAGTTVATSGDVPSAGSKSQNANSKDKAAANEIAVQSIGVVQPEISNSCESTPSPETEVSVKQKGPTAAWPEAKPGISGDSKSVDNFATPAKSFDTQNAREDLQDVTPDQSIPPRNEMRAKATVKKDRLSECPEARKLAKQSLHRSALISTGHVRATAPTGCNFVCSDGLPSAAGKSKKRKSDSDDAAAKNAADYEQWKRSVLAARCATPNPASGAPNSGSKGVQGSLLGFVRTQIEVDETQTLQQPCESSNVIYPVLPDSLPSAAAPHASEQELIQRIPLREQLADAAERRLAAALEEPEVSA